MSVIDNPDKSDKMMQYVIQTLQERTQLQEKLANAVENDDYLLIQHLNDQLGSFVV